MKAIRVQNFNDVPAIEDVPIPDIAPDQVLIRVQAAALNPLDTMVVSGLARHFFDITLPITLATDFAGTIERVGSAVTQWKAGDRVIAWADAGSSGGLAEFAAIQASACVALPPSLSAAEGAAIPTAGITAWHTLFSAAGLKAGEVVLIHAGAGGVGSFAVQFAHKAGARVIATASGDGLALARSLGADEVIDHQTQDFTKLVSGVDVVIDLVGGDTQLRSFGVLRAGGRLIATAMPPDEAAAKACGVSASMFYAKPYADRLGELVNAIAEQGVRVVIDRNVPFAAFEEAWARLTSRNARGKIVVSGIQAVKNMGTLGSASTRDAQRPQGNMVRCLLGLALFASLGLGSFPDAKAAGALPKESVLPVSLALQALQAAIDHCRKDGYQVGIAVVDRSGIVRALARGDGAAPHTLDSGRKKAYTAVGLRRPTSDVVTLIAKAPELQGLQNMNNEILALGGGLPIEFAGEVVGGIGVAGAPGGHLDDACAQAGLDAIGATRKLPLRE